MFSTEKYAWSPLYNKI